MTWRMNSPTGVRGCPPLSTGVLERVSLMGAHDIVPPMPVPAPTVDARAVVTGASQNIGEALAIELASRGHHLIVTARREDVLRTRILLSKLAEGYQVHHPVRTNQVRAHPAWNYPALQVLAAVVLLLLGRRVHFLNQVNLFVFLVAAY